MLSRRRLLLSGLALGLSARTALAQSYGNEADPFGGMEAGPDAGGELFDPALLPPAESPIDFPVPVIPDRRIRKQFRRQMVEFDGPEEPGTLVVDPDNRFLYVADLGKDEIAVYNFDASSGKLTPHTVAALKPGSGPRHIAFSRDRRYLYVVNELTATVTTLRHDAATASLEELQTISTLPMGYRGDKSAAEISVDPSGRFLFASNRFHAPAQLVDGDDGGLVHHDALAARVDAGIGGAQIDRQVTREQRQHRTKAQSYAPSAATATWMPFLPRAFT